VTDPYGGRYGGAAGLPPVPGRPRRWVTLGLPLALGGLIAVLLVGYLLVDTRWGTEPPPASTPAPGSIVPSPELAGEWSGEGTLARCAGFDQGCPRTRTLSLSVDCSGGVCAVTPLDRSYGRPPLDVADGRYQAAGPLPAEVAPTCGGAPTSSGLWRLELTVRDGRLVGSYAESTVQSFDCGATGVSWDVVLERR
jgi:hypothetical protein